MRSYADTTPLWCPSMTHDWAPEEDWHRYAGEAEQAFAAADLTAIEDARVRYLGRKSALALALREVRDRETGMLLNRIRQRREAAVGAREAALEGEELDRRLREEVVDVTLPGEELPLGS